MKSYFVASFVALLTALALIVFGLFSNAPSMVMFSVLCNMPVFIAIFFFALGKFSNAYSVVKKAEHQPVRNESGKITRRPVNTEILG